MTISYVLVLLTTLLLSGGLLWFFFGSRPGAQSAEVSDEVRRADVVQSAMMAAAAMALSSLSVVGNATRLRRYQPRACTGAVPPAGPPITRATQDMSAPVTSAHPSLRR